MRAKWFPKVVETDKTMAAAGDDGRLYEVPRLTISEEEIKQIAEGYECPACQEPFPHAFPETCPLCGFPVKEKGAELFEMMFGGRRTDPLGSSIDVEAELAAMEKRRFERERAEGLRAKGIFVPGPS